MSNLKSDFYMLHAILSQYWKKESWWCALIIVANIRFCSTSEYKGECPSYSVEVRCDHVISVGQCKVNKSDTHPIWVKAFSSNSWGLTLQFPLPSRTILEAKSSEGAQIRLGPWVTDKQSFPYWTCHRRKKETFVVWSHWDFRTVLLLWLRLVFPA